MNTSISHAVRVAVLAAASLIPQVGKGQEADSKAPPIVPKSASGADPTNFDSALKLKMPDAKKLAELPPRIVEMATKMGIDLSDVKLESGVWIACKGDQCTPIAKALPSEGLPQTETINLRGLRPGDVLTITGHQIKSHQVEAESNYGIPGLGKFRRQSDGSISFQADKDFKGTVTYAQGQPRGTTLQTEPSALVHKPYSREYLQEIKALLADPQVTVVLVVSVPKLCGPCEMYKGDVKDAASRYKRADKTEIRVVDFTSFEEARATMGMEPSSKFPATYVFPRGHVQSEGDSGIKPFLSDAGRPYQQRYGRMQSEPFRHFVKDVVDAAATTLRGFKGVLMGR